MLDLYELILIIDLIFNFFVVNLDLYLFNII